MKQEVRELVLTGHKEIAKLERFVEEICEYYLVGNDYLGNILLASTEATNILFSLNDSLENNKIAVSFDRSRKGMVFKIKLMDGFQKDSEPEDFLDREIRRHKLSKEIFIIKSLTDEITISIDAKSIILVFYISSMNYEKSLYRINKLKEYWVTKENLIHKK